MPLRGKIDAPPAGGTQWPPSPSSAASRRRRAGKRRGGTTLTVGVDVGGTWVRLTAGGPSRRRARLATADTSTLPDAIRTVLHRWKAPPSQVAALVVASRGIWSETERRRAQRALRGVARRVRVISDAEAAYRGALGDGPGVLILAGTGSIVIGRDRRRGWRRAGGLGPLLGDEGSAFWIGREWLRATAKSSDLERVHSLVTGPTPVARIAALAPRVLRRARHGDRRAARIVREAQRALAVLAAGLARRLRLRPPVRMSWAGSLLANDRWFRTGVRRELARIGAPVAWVSPAESADRAAARLAEALGRRGPQPPPGATAVAGRSRSARP